MLLGLVLVGIPFLITALLALFFGDSDRGETFLDFLSKWLFVVFPRTFRNSTVLCCGARGPEYVDSTYHYLFKTNNPLVQIFYMGVVLGGYLSFVLYAQPLLPNVFLSSVHAYAGFVIVTACLTVFLMASASDPGIVTPLNVEEKVRAYSYDGVVFQEGSWCKTCKTAKPARSKHCSLCEVCVSRFDHHCIWIANCVGEGNHHLFLTFLLLHTFLCVYGTFVLLQTLRAILVEERLFEATFQDASTGIEYKASWGIVFSYLMVNYGAVMFLFILCSVMAVALVAFTGWHLYLASMNVTTNESYKFKWARMDIADEGGDPSVVRNVYRGDTLSNFVEVFCKRRAAPLPPPESVSLSRKEGTVQGNGMNGVEDKEERPQWEFKKGAGGTVNAKGKKKSADPVNDEGDLGGGNVRKRNPAEESGKEINGETTGGKGNDHAASITER
uniref:Palmitoyltransferase n=1 Tax=Chromera velia CCMP2878 TaxID=1169474 RepID=A0A0G4F2M7_9ALVE|mmetsp:Transcript_29040/g.56881  ORF Transcript_29040/g.56881 Transcript_29040/m.56881 type:complete len:443 (+) Transcript_29040:243-1571(+)|eukprot:Cvel_2671.t1-p1 / transcript=Cvel_2671.t1 / gene=Cvel_2671 / organism=Chromera_velia_CCMP2878 / gene_product=Probable S-acyltransferase At3g04970, putative / transcript_product=Probable S-acyltransferase At3g04970, putative / location=Cvel_scaffold106:120218-123310(-) / protein_length=442 / sequence_SO=supercontig / SO=protein_coding / is_pseudo=false